MIAYRNLMVNSLLHYIGNLIYWRCRKRHILCLTDYFLINDYDCIKDLTPKVKDWFNNLKNRELYLCNSLITLKGVIKLQMLIYS